MGLFDGIKKLQNMAEQAKVIADQLKTVVGASPQSTTVQPSAVPAQMTEDVIPDASGRTIIQSEGQMTSWLESVSSQTKSPTIMKVIDAQLQVIKFVKAPSLLGMVLDNMIAALHQTLREASSENEKTEIRETMSLMIHNLIFFSDAQLHYAIDKNKQEAKQLLSSAGDMLAKSVASVATLAAGPMAVAGVVIKNIFATEEMQNGFFGRLIGWIVDRSQIEKHIEDFNTSLRNLFDTFDKYAALIGPSIQINGMLHRYESQLVEIYRNAVYESLYNQFSKEIKEFLIDNQPKNLETYKKLCLLIQPLIISIPQKNEIRRRDNNGLVQEIISGFVGQEGLTYVKEKFLTFDKEKNKAISNFNYKYLQEIQQEIEHLEGQFTEQVKQFRDEIRVLDGQAQNETEKITALNAQIASLSFIQISSKKELERQKIELDKKLENIKNHQNALENKTKKAEKELALCKKILVKNQYYLTKAKGIEDDLTSYATGLSNITAKYALSSLAQTTEISCRPSISSNDAARQKFDKMWEMALADGEISDKEKTILWKYAEAAGIDEGEFELMIENKVNL